MYQTFIKPFAKDASKFVLDTLFPISCISCGQEGSFICDVCKMQLTRLEQQHCIVCQKPALYGITHPSCQTAHGVEGLISFLNYHDEKVAKIIIHGKYYFLPGVYEILGKMMAEKIKTEHSHLLFPPANLSALSSRPKGEGWREAPGWFLCPIPLHPWRHRWRGFNQADVICQTLANHLSLERIDALVRSKPTKTQKDLKKEARMKNVDGAFKLKAGTDVRNKNLILVDDVTTTGSTLLEATKILKRNGAASVWCLTIARD